MLHVLRSFNLNTKIKHKKSHYSECQPNFIHIYIFSHFFLTVFGGQEAHFVFPLFCRPSETPYSEIPSQMTAHLRIGSPLWGWEIAGSEPGTAGLQSCVALNELALLPRMTTITPTNEPPILLLISHRCSNQWAPTTACKSNGWLWPLSFSLAHLGKGRKGGGKAGWHFLTWINIEKRGKRAEEKGDDTLYILTTCGSAVCFL